MKNVGNLLCFLLLIYLTKFFVSWSYPKTYEDSGISNIADTGDNFVGTDIVNSEPCNSLITEESITSGKIAPNLLMELRRLSLLPYSTS